MLMNIFKYAAVICLTFSSMVQMLAVPQTTIIEEMKDKLRNCSFPPAEVLKENSQGGIFSVCAVWRPLIIDGKPSAADMNFAFGKYLCMELFDLSLQLCSMNVSKEALPLSEEDLNNISLGQNVSTFCERLLFSNGRAKSTGVWANIAIETLKNRDLCESNCITHNYLNPVCGAIYWANKLIIADEQKRTMSKGDSQGIQGVKPTDRDKYTYALGGEKPTQMEIDAPTSGFAASAAEVQPSEERESSQFKTESASLPIGKEATLPKVLNSSIAESKETSKSHDIVRPPINEETPKAPEINAVGPTLEKHESVVSQIQVAAVTSTVAPVTIPTSITLEKEEDHEEDRNRPSRVETGDTPGIDESRIPPDEMLPNLPPKGMGQDIFADEGLGDEDAHTGGNNANELTIENRGFHDAFVDAQDSHFFAYFLTMVVICIVGYLLFHNKQKIIALALEGRRMQGSRRRPNTSSYKKLDSNLEEAVTSTCSSSSVTHVIF